MSLTNFQIETLTKLRLLLVLTAVEVPDMPDPENWEQNVLDLLDALALGISNIQAGAATSLPWSSITEKPTAFPPESHSHQWSQVQNKPSEYPPESHQHGWTDLTGIPATFPPSLHTHPEYEGALTSVAWADVTDKPLTFPPDTHSHPVAWADVDGKPATFPPSPHGHLWSDIADRPTTWAWANLTGIPSTFPPDVHSHAVAWADVQNKPLTFPPDTHSHTVSWNALTDRPSNLTGIAGLSLTGNWLPCRSTGTGWMTLAVGANGLQLIQSATPGESLALIEAAPAVHAHSWDSVTGKPSTFTPSAHAHGWAEITGKPETFTPSTHTHPSSEIAITTFDNSFTSTVGCSIAIAPASRMATLTFDLSRTTTWSNWLKAFGWSADYTPLRDVYVTISNNAGQLGRVRILAGSPQLEALAFYQAFPSENLLGQLTFRY